MSAPARPLAALVDHLRTERRAITATVVLVCVSLLCLTTISVLLAAAVGHVAVLRQAPPAWLWPLLAGLVLLRALLTWGEMDASHSLAFRVLARLRVALFDRYAVAFPARSRENHGRAAATAMTDTERLEFFYAHTVAQLLAAVVNAALGLTVLVLLDAGVAAVVAVALTAVTATVPMGRHRLDRLGGEVVTATGTLSDHVVDVLGSLREVLGYGLHEPVRRQVAQTGARAARAAGALETTHRLLAGSREAIVTLAAVGVLVTAFAGDVAPQHVAALVVLALATVAPVADAAATWAQLPSLRASAARVGTELARPAVVEPAARPAPLPEGPLGLALRDVGFRYADRWVLRGLDLEVAPGEHVGLRGPSGVGKSTVVALAGRLWDPDLGTVELTGAGGAVPLTALDEADLRAAVGVVEQDGRLFAGTVAEELTAGSDASWADAVDLLERLDLADALGPDDQLGEAGVRLSGGQQARLRLVRALLRRPRVLVLDEPTADLDAAAAARVSEVLRALPATLLVVSHREETLATMDRVVTLTPPPEAR
ncbi:ABC transporter ATP-binding protein [Xylanimonas oleitrophica]|uniref:ABC transporter ATP-binding protein n=1 Tax=Xylanimonas oleitrophica TaxID=2607479 RepID=A0A2W5WQZ2_9MICO|nr:ABC transporter ATP-binding protein [Xylanimonas oleitrophica]PZR53737.1 ABC transporter ATP-binding protein [Xylanimonas oleitrophica]